MSFFHYDSSFVLRNYDFLTIQVNGCMRNQIMRGEQAEVSQGLLQGDRVSGALSFFFAIRIDRERVEDSPMAAEKPLHACHAMVPSFVWATARMGLTFSDFALSHVSETHLVNHVQQPETALHVAASSGDAGLNLGTALLQLSSALDIHSSS